MRGSVTMIIQISRPSRASRLRRSRPAWWPVFVIVMVIVGLGTAALTLAHR
jgi:hypothetical protein